MSDAAHQPSPTRRTRLSPWLVAALATVPTLMSTFETVTFARMANRTMPVWRAFVTQAPQWYSWAILAPIIIRLGARFPLRRPLRAPHLAIHIVASLIASLFVAFAAATVNVWVNGTPERWLATIRNWFIGQLPATTIVYAAIFGVSYAVANAIELRERDRRAAELEAQLRDAQLSALRMQLQPHFLFNSLNAIMALVRDQDTTRAVRALSLLGDVLRATINAGTAQETTLAEEMAFVTRYLEIERLRFGDRLRITVDIPDPLRAALVPTFVLQPFVENALKHGMLHDRNGNELAIRAHETNGALVLSVRDDGRGLPSDGATIGVGITNARARLDRMYGDAARLSVANVTNASGAVVEIHLPLRSPAK